MFLRRRITSKVHEIRILRTINEQVKNKNVSIFDPDNFADYFSDRENVINNLKRRKLKLDVNAVFDQHEKYTKLSKEKESLEQLKYNVAQQMKTLKNSKDNTEFENLKAEGKEVKKKLKELLNYASGYRLVRSLYSSLLSQLPASLHHDTPDISKSKLQWQLQTNLKKHSELLKEVLFLRSHEVNKEQNYSSAYLLGEAALFEHQLITTLKMLMLRRFPQYQYVSLSDMVRHFVIEATSSEEGVEVLNSTNEGIHSLNLVGTDLSAFIAFFASLDLTALTFPFKLYSFGSNYRSNHCLQYGLYDLSQYNQGQMFAASESEEEADEVFNEQLSFINNFYEKSSLPYKIENVGCEELAITESKRVNYHIWSPSFNRYFLCGHVVSHGDCLSRRFSFKRGNKLLYLVSSVPFKVSPLIACYVENYQESTFDDLKLFLNKF